MVDILDEIRDDLKDEKALGIIKKYSSFVFTLMVAIIVGVAIKMWWINYKENQAHQEGASFMMAFKKLQANNVEDAIKTYTELSEHGKSNYSALAQLHLAGYYLDQKEYDKAEKEYEKLANSSHGKILKDYAKLNQLKMHLSQDKPEYAKIESKLQAYIKSDSVFKYQAQEFLAVAEANLKQIDKAKQTIKDIEKADNAPFSIKQRAKLLDKILAE